MERVKGVPITDYCDLHNLATSQRLNLFIQVCHAIQHAHQKGIIHRDIKPSNVLVIAPAPNSSGQALPKVIDFGIAKATSGRLTDLTIHTRLTEFIGTPAYMSPEQAEMQAVDIDTRSDIYSLGVLLYELLTGQTPFDSRRLLEAGLEGIRRIIREEDPPRPSTRLSTLEAKEKTDVARRRQCEPPALIKLVGGDLDWIVLMTLEKDRARRYQTANDLAVDIQRHLENEPIVARRPTWFDALSKWRQRNKKVLTGASAASVLTVAALLVAALVWRGSVSRFLAIPPPTVLPEKVRAQQAGGVLDLIYTGAPPSPPSRSLPPAIDFGIQAKCQGAADFISLQDGDSLASGVDDYVLLARMFSEGYLYIIQVDSSGKTQWLFPSNDTCKFSSGSNPVERGQVLQVPPPERIGFFLDQSPGDEHVYVVLSLTRWPELELALSRAAQAQPVATTYSVQEPNSLQSRGIEDVRVNDGRFHAPTPLSAKRVWEGRTYQLTVTEKPVRASGAFLVIERWFKHVSDR